MTADTKTHELAEKIKAEFLNRGQDLLRTVYRVIFDQHPDIIAIRWNQYTPYFNDGDDCVFGVNEVTFATTNNTGTVPAISSLGNHEIEFQNKTYIFIDTYSTPYETVAKQIDSLNREIKEVLRGAFGDHVELTIYRDGVMEIEQYEHE